MEISNLVQLGQAVQTCATQGASLDALRVLQTELVANRDTKEPLLVELLQALENLTLQYIGGSLEIDGELPHLLKEVSATIKQLTNTPDMSQDTRDQLLGGIIERIDIEASGGFEIDDDQEFVATAARIDEPTSKPASTTKLAHLSALSETLQFKTKGSKSGNQLNELLSQQAELIDSIRQELQPNFSSASRLEEHLSSSALPNLEIDSPILGLQLHPTLVDELGDLLSIFNELFRDVSAQPAIKLGSTDQEIEVILTFQNLAMTTEELRRVLTQSVNPQLAQTFSDIEISQFCVAVAADAMRNDQTMPLMDWVHKLRAKVGTHCDERQTSLSIRLPIQTHLESLTTFSVEGAKYGIREAEVLAVVSQPEISQDSFEPTIRYRGQDFRIRPIATTQTSPLYASNVLLLTGADRIAVPIDERTTKTVKLVNGKFPQEDLVSGCVELADQSIYTLIDSTELVNIKRKRPQQISPSKRRAIADSSVECLDWFEPRMFDITLADSSLHMQTLAQEQCPEVVLTTPTQAANHLRQASFITQKQIPILVLPTKNDAAFSIVLTEPLIRVANRMELRHVLTDLGLLDTVV